MKLLAHNEGRELRGNERQLLLLANELNARGVTVIMVTHSTTLMAALDKLALLKGGTLEMFGPSAAVLARLRSPNGASQRVVAFPPGKSSEAHA